MWHRCFPWKLVKTNFFPSNSADYNKHSEVKDFTFLNITSIPCQALGYKQTSEKSFCFTSQKVMTGLALVDLVDMNV